MTKFIFVESEIIPTITLKKGRKIFQFIIAGMTSFLVSVAQGAGFYIPEVGTPHSLGSAGVANPTNTVGADAAWSNPAGMVFLKNDEIFSGFQLVVPNVRFDTDASDAGGNDGGNAGILTPVPSFFYAHKYSDNLSFGLSMAATMGGGVDYGNNFAGRYSTISAQLSAVGLSPSIGYKINDRFSVGMGVSIIYTLFEQDIAINPAILPTINGGDGRLKIEDADDLGFQPFFSANYQLSDELLLGVVYRAEMDVELSGDVKVKNVALPIGADKIDIDWTNPQWLEVGLKYRYTNKDTLYFSAGWQDWSKFSKNQLAFSGGRLNPTVAMDRNFKDTWHAGLAYAHHISENNAFSIAFAYSTLR